MHRYEELERLYYKRLFFKIFIFILIIAVFIFGFLFLLNTKKEVKKIKETKKIEKNISVAKVEKKEIKKVEIKKAEKNETKIQKPKENKAPKLTFVLPKIGETKEVKKSFSKYMEKNEIKKTPTHKLITSEVNISVLIKKFNQTKDYNLAIAISKYYLKHNKLKQAQIWALNANSIDPQKPDSWIIFANILLKKGNGKKAKEILKVYLDSYGNNDIIEEKLRSINGK